MCTHTRLDTKRGCKNAKKLNPLRFVHILYKPMIVNKTATVMIVVPYMTVWRRQCSILVEPAIGNRLRTQAVWAISCMLLVCV